MKQESVLKVSHVYTTSVWCIQLQYWGGLLIYSETISRKFLCGQSSWVPVNPNIYGQIEITINSKSSGNQTYISIVLKA